MRAESQAVRRIAVSRHICGGTLTPLRINTRFIVLFVFDDCYAQKEAINNPENVRMTDNFSSRVSTFIGPSQNVGQLNLDASLWSTLAVTKTGLLLLSGLPVSVTSYTLY